MLQFTEDRIYNDSPWEIEGSSKVRLVTATPNLDETIAYVCRVSSKNQENRSIQGLIKYCMKHGHVSIAETGSITMEIITPLAIALQIKRHRSFTYQGFSMRYQDATVMEDLTSGLPAADKMFYLPTQSRYQDTKNRQNSIPSEDAKFTKDTVKAMELAFLAARKSYEDMLEMGVAKELARMVLPQSTYTRFYMTGNPRSWMHYLKVREEEGVVQKEHIDVAVAAKRVFREVCPVIYGAFWGG